MNARGTEATLAARRLAFVLIDGVADVDIPELGNRTPLGAAHIPHLDSIAAAGWNGQLDPVEAGLACGSDTAHLSILGYDPRKYYRGRGAFESMGTGLRMKPGDIAFKSNFATIDDATDIVTSRRADRRFEDVGPILCASLDGLPLPSFPEHSISVRYATEHRCGVVVRGQGLSDAISGTDPLKDNLSLQVVKPMDETKEAIHTAAVAQEVSTVLREALRHHPVNVQRVAEGKKPANIVLLRGCGSRISAPTFGQLHSMRGAMVAPTKIIAGLGASLSMQLLSCPRATGDYRSDFAAKAECIADALIAGVCDFGFLHIKAVDDTGHDRATALKVAYLEVVDLMVGQLLRRLTDAQNNTLDSSGHERQPPGSASPAKFALCVTGDHSTPVVFGDHSHEPVPFAIANIEDLATCGAVLPSLPLPFIAHPGSDLKSVPELKEAADHRQSEAKSWQLSSCGDAVTAYNERSAAEGALGRFPGCEVMPLIKTFCGISPHRDMSERL